jgi:hypothetical protein
VPPHSSHSDLALTGRVASRIDVSLSAFALEGFASHVQVSVTTILYERLFHFCHADQPRRNTVVSEPTSNVDSSRKQPYLPHVIANRPKTRTNVSTFPRNRNQNLQIQTINKHINSMNNKSSNEPKPTRVFSIWTWFITLLVLGVLTISGLIASILFMRKEKTKLSEHLASFENHVLESDHL